MEFINDLLDNHQAFVTATLSGVTALVVAVITVWAVRRKNAADVAKQLTDIAMGLIEPLEEQVADLKKEQAHMEREIGQLKAENELLHKWSQLLFSQVVESGGEPISFEQVRKLVK